MATAARSPGSTLLRLHASTSRADRLSTITSMVITTLTFPKRTIYTLLVNGLFGDICGFMERNTTVGSHYAELRERWWQVP